MVPALTLSGLGRSAAFDKGDLLYLRDEEEKRRFKETELRDSERIRFQALRAGVDSHRDPAAPAPAPAPPPGNPAGAPTGLLRNPPKPTRCVHIESPPIQDLHMIMLPIVMCCRSSLDALYTLMPCLYNEDMLVSQVSCLRSCCS